MPLQALDGGQQQVDGDGVGTCDAHDAAGVFVLAFDFGAQVEGCAFHAAGGCQGRFACRREQVSIFGTQEQLGAQLGLQCIQPPPHGGLVDAQAARGGAQGGGSCQREKDAGVVPVHGGVHPAVVMQFCITTERNCCV
ncbi:hypothetical protein D3C72_1592870 [compost metagenome]